MSSDMWGNSNYALHARSSPSRVRTSLHPQAQADVAAVIGGEALVGALGPADQSSVFAAVADVTAEAPAAGRGVALKQAEEAAVTERQRAERRLIPASDANKCLRKMRMSHLRSHSPLEPLACHGSIFLADELQTSASCVLDSIQRRMWPARTA
jgi:hypothetical protein